MSGQATKNWESEVQHLLDVVNRLRDEARALLVHQMRSIIADDRDIYLSMTGYMGANDWNEARYLDALSSQGLIGQHFILTKEYDNTEIAMFMREKPSVGTYKVQPSLMHGASLDPLTQSAERLKAIQKLRRRVLGLNNTHPNERVEVISAFSEEVNKQHKVILAGLPKSSIISRVLMQVSSALKSLLHHLMPRKKVVESVIAMGSPFGLFVCVKTLDKQVQHAQKESAAGVVLAA